MPAATAAAGSIAGAADGARDQSYFLFSTTPAQLAFLRFPLGGLASKAETRALAARFGLAVADKPDSQDICFVPDGDYAGLGAGGTLGRGLAADALIGGRGGHVQISPIADSRLTGLNFEGGLGELHLRYAGMETRRERYRSDKPEAYGF